MRDDLLRFLAFRGTYPVELQTIRPVPAFAIARNHEEALRLASLVDEDAGGVYVVCNDPSEEHVSSFSAGEWIKSPTLTNADITRRAVLFVDVDAKRAPDTSATEGEKAHAVRVAGVIADRLASILGSRDPIGVGDSGNGASVFVALDSLPESPEVTGIARDILHALDALYSDDHVHVDPKVFNPSRLCPAFGTMKRKGPADDPERPHRRTSFRCEEDVEAIDLEGLRALRDALAPKRVETPALAHVPSSPQDDRVRLAREYLARTPGAVDGENGGTATFRVAMCVTRGFDLDEDSAYPLMAEWNAKCSPPWEEHDLRRKIHEGATKGQIPRGSMVHGSAGPGGYQVLDATSIFAPLAPVDYLIQALDMAGGAPTMIAGYGFSGKTVAAQSMAIALAAPRGPVWRLVWDLFPARTERTKVVHVDFEQGERLTRERYQRLARGAGVPFGDLSGYLGLVSLPSLHLDDPRAEDALVRAADGAGLVIVDSLRAAAPSLEENSSDFRRPLDMLLRVSDRTGATALVIHHARKPSKDSVGGAKMAVRGSGALFDGVASMLVFQSDSREEPTLVNHEKARTSGVPTDDFQIVVEDVAIAGDPRGGLRVRGKQVEATTPEEKARQSFEDLQAKVLEELRKEGSVGSLNTLAAKLVCRRASLTAVMDDLVDRDRVVKLGTYHSPLYRLVPKEGN